MWLMKLTGNGKQKTAERIFCGFSYYFRKITFSFLQALPLLF